MVCVILSCDCNGMTPTICINPGLDLMSWNFSEIQLNSSGDVEVQLQSLVERRQVGLCFNTSAHYCVYCSDNNGFLNTFQSPS